MDIKHRRAPRRRRKKTETKRKTKTFGFKMGKFHMELVTVVVLGIVAVCLGDKDPTLSLRPPGSSSPVFSSSIDSIPVSSASSNQQSVYSKRPSTVHSTASASASLGSSSVTQDQSGSGGRHNNPWFSQGVGYEFNGVDSNSAGGSSVINVVKQCFFPFGL